MNSPKIDEIQADFSDLYQKFDVILFGSVVEGGFRPESDIDIAIITRNRNESANIQLQKTSLEKYGNKYDIRIFELYPIYIQISIINNFRVIFGDLLSISEYFYQFRKRWNDCKYRIMENQFESFRERIDLLKPT